MRESMRAGSWQYWAIAAFKPLHAIATLRMKVCGVQWKHSRIEKMQTDTVFPTLTNSGHYWPL
jgi:hypothetical protein